jgi:hypothetical protein
VRSLGSGDAEGKTFELFAERGPAPEDFDALFAPLQADPPGALDAVYDPPNMPVEEEPPRVQDDLQRIAGR